MLSVQKSKISFNVKFDAVIGFNKSCSNVCENSSIRYARKFAELHELIIPKVKAYNFIYA